MKLSEVDFLEPEDVERIHHEAIALGGGSLGIRDRGLLESAVAAPQAGAYGHLVHSSLARMAAALAYALAKNHAFIDGNKRAAFGAAMAFLKVNGFTLDPEGASWVDIFEALAKGPLTREDLTALFAREMGADPAVEGD